MRDRNINLDDLNRLRLWTESQPEVPEGEWTKTLALSNSAARANSRRLFSYLGRRRPEKSSKPISNRLSLRESPMAGRRLAAPSGLPFVQPHDTL